MSWHDTYIWKVFWKNQLVLLLSQYLLGAKKDMSSFNTHSLIASIIIALLSIYIFFSRCLLIETKLLVSLTTDLFIYTSIDSVYIRDICALHICKFKWIICFSNISCIPEGRYWQCHLMLIASRALAATRAAYPTYANLEQSGRN